jgi:hypothetical protein
MHMTIRSSSISLLLLAGCQPAAAPTTPASDPPSASEPAATEPSQPADSASPAEDPAPAETPSASGGAVPKCGVGGTARQTATTCMFIVDTSSGECCFSTQDAACREAGCATADCSLQKSNPPKAICTGGASTG